jgi:hypothetical protein
VHNGDVPAVYVEHHHLACRQVRQTHTHSGLQARYQTCNAGSSPLVRLPTSEAGWAARPEVHATAGSIKSCKSVLSALARPCSVVCGAHPHQPLPQSHYCSGAWHTLLVAAPEPCRSLASTWGRLGRTTWHTCSHWCCAHVEEQYVPSLKARLHAATEHHNHLQQQQYVLQT